MTQPVASDPIHMRKVAMSDYIYIYTNIYIYIYINANIDQRRTNGLILRIQLGYALCHGRNMMKNVDSICRYPGSGKVQGLPRPCHRETSKGGCPIQHCSQKNLYLAGGLEHDFYFSIYWEFHHPNSRTHIFQRGRYTTNQIWLIYWI